MYTGEARGAGERGKFGRAANDKLILLPRVRRGMLLIGATALSASSVASNRSNLQIFFFFPFVRFVLRRDSFAN